MRHPHRHPRLPAALLTGALLLAAAASQLVAAGDALAACGSNTKCRVQPVYGRVACDSEVQGLIHPVCQNRFGSEGPSIPAIKTGADGAARVTATLPCLLFDAMMFVESSWHMFCHDTCGSQGLTNIGGGCGYGYAQITSGMRASDLENNTATDFDVDKVASSATYNLATGLQFMANKWNGRKAIGSRDPEIIEHWYYAVWAYNSFSWTNNPNNPKYPEGRTPWYCEGTSSRSSYPYQEAVWGYMRCPPSRSGGKLWAGADITYPNASEICASEGCSPSALSDPLPSHKDPCQKGLTGPVYDPAAAVDSDGDGAVDALDCAPNDAAIHPGAVEVCNGVDDNCDGQVDEGDLCGPGQHCAGGVCLDIPSNDAGIPAPEDGGEMPSLPCTSSDQCPDGYICDGVSCVQDPVPLPNVPDASGDGGWQDLTEADAGHGGSAQDGIDYSQVTLHTASCSQAGSGGTGGLWTALIAFLGSAALPVGRRRQRQRGTPPKS